MAEQAGTKSYLPTTFILWPWIQVPPQRYTLELTCSAVSIKARTEAKIGQPQIWVRWNQSLPLPLTRQIRRRFMPEQIEQACRRAPIEALTGIVSTTDSILP